MAVVFIVEDNRKLFEIEKIALESADYTVEGFERGKDFLNRLERTIPDLAIIDLMLPDTDGLLIIKRIRECRRTQDLPVLVVTARTEEEDIEIGLNVGADDYITKPFHIKIFLARVRALLRRTKKDEAPVAEYQDIIVDASQMICRAGENSIPLTKRECELLFHLLNNAGKTLTRELLMDRIWGGDYTGESRTLDVHINSLRQKLGEHGKYIKTIRGIGYRLE